MEVVIKQTADEVGVLAADLIERVVESKPRAVIGLATGSSPLAIYASLAQRVDAGTLDFTGVRGFA
ncbi:MAG: glucosamine-6-phosphate deaminase, partial [Humibacter sp.]